MPHVLQWQAQIERIYNCTQMHIWSVIVTESEEQVGVRKQLFWLREKNNRKNISKQCYHIKSNFNTVFFFFFLWITVQK